MNDKHLKFLEVLKKNAGLIYLSCEKYGIVPKTYYNWLNESKEFAEAVNSINESLIDMAEGTLYEKIKQKDLTATIFFLKTKGRNRGYIEKYVTESTIKKDLSIDKLDKETIDMAEKIFKKLDV